MKNAHLNPTLAAIHYGVRAADRCLLVRADGSGPGTLRSSRLNRSGPVGRSMPELDVVITSGSLMNGLVIAQLSTFVLN